MIAPSRITYHPAPPNGAAPRFSIMLPSWNNLPYLQLCVDSLRRHSAFAHQIIVHLNEGADGSLAWVQEQGLDYTYSAKNVGICYALNAAASLARTDYIVFLNDDMYALPGWDEALWEEIQAIGHEYFFLSGTMIEPTDTGNACVIAPLDYGREVESFREEALLREFRRPEKPDWQGATWPPNVVHRRIWELVGGYSVEFSPGMSSDPDFSMKLWQAGVRLFKGVGRSRVYHFQTKSTGKVQKNPGNRQFLEKWGLPRSAFFRHYLHRGEPFSGPLPEPEESPALRAARLKGWIKRRFS